MSNITCIAFDDEQHCFQEYIVSHRSGVDKRRVVCHFCGSGSACTDLHYGTRGSKDTVAKFNVTLCI